MGNGGKSPGKLVQANLFDDLPISEVDGQSGLVRMDKQDSGTFSPLQKKFNMLARKIEQLRLEIEERTEACKQLLNHWAKKLEPALNTVATLQIKLAFALETQALGFKLGVRQRESVAYVILELLNNAFCQIPAKQDAQDLFSRWNDMSFDEELAGKQDEIVEVLGNLVRDEFGIDIDEDTLREGPEAIQKLLEERIKGMESQAGRKPRKKTPKQLEKEERERQAEAIEKKTLRSLYLSLVKVIHPDTEPDETSKITKEATMKELTNAYETGDLHTLLRIERDWINRELSNSAPLPEEKLKAYISALKDQAMELENELECLHVSPRFAPIQYFAGYGPEHGKSEINNCVRQEKMRATLLKDMLSAFCEKLDKQSFMSRIRDMSQ